MNRERVHTIIGLLALLVAGCNASYPFQPSNPVPSALQIHYRAPLVGPVLVGQSFSFNAYVVNSDGGMRDVTATSTWVSSNTNVVRVTASPSGFTAIAPGIADLSATYQEVSNTLSVTVIEPDRQFPSLGLLSVNQGLSPATPPRVVGQTGYLIALVRNTATQSQDVTAQTIWSSSNPLVVTVTREGRLATIRAVATGTAVITAAFDGVTASYGLSIQP